VEGQGREWALNPNAATQTGKKRWGEERWLGVGGIHPRGMQHELGFLSLSPRSDGPTGQGCDGSRPPHQSDKRVNRFRSNEVIGRLPYMRATVTKMVCVRCKCALGGDLIQNKQKNGNPDHYVGHLLCILYSRLSIFASLGYTVLLLAPPTLAYISQVVARGNVVTPECILVLSDCT
jgi:hypothetical protein